MGIQSKYKKRGSTFSLIVMLIALIVLAAIILFWPAEATAKSAPTAQDDVEATTLIKAGDMSQGLYKAPRCGVFASDTNTECAVLCIRCRHFGD